MAARVSAPARQRPQLALLIRLGAAFVLSIMLVLVKLASESGVALVEILFWRQLPTIPILLGWFAATRGLAKLKSHYMGKHLTRAVYGIIGMACNFGAVTLLPLAEATTFNFTSAIWAVILSALLLREKVGLYRWGAVIAGFVGVLIIAQPGSGTIPLFGAGVALAAAFMIALISIQIRDLSQTDDPLTIVFWFAAFTTPSLLLAMPFVTEPHTPYQWSLLAGLALFGLLGQFLLTASLRLANVSSVIVMDYSAIIWASLFGIFVFERIPASSVYFGAPLVILAGIVVAWRERTLALSRRGALQIE